MAALDSISRVFQEMKTIAVVGMSSHHSKAAHWVPKFLLEQGYTIIPVNPNHPEILGLNCYPDLAAVPNPIEVVLVFRPSAAAEQVVAAAIARKAIRGDVKAIWLQSGITTREGQRLAAAQDILYIENRCMFREYERGSRLPDPR